MDNTNRQNHLNDSLPATRLNDQAATMMTDKTLIGQVFAGGKMGAFSAEFPASSTFMPKELDLHEEKITRPSDASGSIDSKGSTEKLPDFQRNQRRDSDSNQLDFSKR